MTTYFTSRRAALAVSSAILLALAGAAQAVTDTVFRYSTPKTGHLTLPPAAFTPSSLAHSYANNGGAIRPLTAGQQTCWSAPVNLPQGAKMTALALWYHLDSGDTGLIQFYRQKLSDGVPALIVSTGIPLTGGVYKPANYPITDAALQAVDNQRYSYFVYVCLTDDGSGTNTLIRGARVTYTYVTAGD